MKKLNTHHYDGQLQARYKEIEGIYKDPPSLDTTYKEIKELINTLLADNQKAQKDTHKILNILRKSKGKSENYDSRNNIHVDKLLPLVWACVKKYDNSAKMIFLEQIMEIKNGPCPQGRTTRLIQLVETTTSLTPDKVTVSKSETNVKGPVEPVEPEEPEEPEETEEPVEMVEQDEPVEQEGMVEPED